MKINIVWKATDELGLEHLQLSESQNEIIADGTIIRVENQTSFRVRYQIRCDARWQVREVKIDLLGANDKSIRLKSDGAGHWTDAEDNRLPVFDGCLEMDISATPFTNTLPIRRLRLEQGESANIEVVYLSLPGLTVQKSKQRYTCLEKAEGREFYLFEELGVFKGFNAEIAVDERGFVTEYPNLFKQISLSRSTAK